MSDYPWPLSVPRIDCSNMHHDEAFREAIRRCRKGNPTRMTVDYHSMMWFLMHDRTLREDYYYVGRRAVIQLKTPFGDVAVSCDDTLESGHGRLFCTDPDIAVEVLFAV